MLFVKTRENLTHGLEIILKIGRNSAFLLFSKENFKKFNSQKIPKLLFFRPKCENLTQGLLIFLNNRLK